MAKKAVGLDIDATSVKAAELTRKGRSLVVSKLAQVNLPQGTIVDGKVVEVKELTKALQILFSNHGLHSDSVVLGLRNSWVTVKTHRVPKMSEKELERALEFEVPSIVSFSVTTPKDVAYDYFVNSSVGAEQEIVVVACSRQNLDPYLEGVKKSGVKLTAIDLPAFNWHELCDAEKRRAFVEISDEQTTIFVALGQVYKVLRIVPIGVSHFLEGIAEAFGASEVEAKNLYSKHNVDYLLMEGSENKRVLRATVQQFVGSILQTLDFVRAQERATQFRSMLDELVLIGNISDVDGVPEMLEKELNLPVFPLKKAQNNQISFDVIPPGRFQCYGSAVALGIRGFER